jgi:hypothetical protein
MAGPRSRRLGAAPVASGAEPAEGGGDSATRLQWEQQKQQNEAILRQRAREWEQQQRMQQAQALWRQMQQQMQQQQLQQQNQVVSLDVV